MVGAVGWDFESSVERAWQRFPSRLADRLAELAVGELLVLDASTAGENGGLPFVAFLGEGAGRFEAEVSSNAYLHARHAIDAHGDASLQERGWRSRTPFSLHRDRRTARTRGGGCCRARRCSRRQLPLAELPFVGTVDGPHLTRKAICPRGDHHVEMGPARQRANGPFPPAAPARGSDEHDAVPHAVGRPRAGRPDRRAVRSRPIRDASPRRHHRSSSTNGSATRSRGIGSAAPWTKARHRGPTSSPVRRRRQPPPTPGPVGSCGCGCVR